MHEPELNGWVVENSRGRSTAEEKRGGADGSKVDLMRKGGADIHIPAWILSAVLCMRCVGGTITECIQKKRLSVYLQKQNALSLDAMRLCIALPLVSH